MPIHTDAKQTLDWSFIGGSRRALPKKWMTSEHRSPEAMAAHLRELVELHPDSARLVNIGTSVGGRPILAIVLGRSDYPEYRLRILGAHHGDETSSAEVAVSAAETLLTDPTHTLILDTHEVWVFYRIAQHRAPGPESDHWDSSFRCQNCGPRRSKCLYHV